MKALLIVDVQNDFCPGGSLAVADGAAVIRPANQLINAFIKSGLPVFFTRDWHPADHSSFADFGGIWPAHCVAGTPGADFHPDLLIPDEAVIISKATAAGADAYSGFEGTDLHKQLTILGVDEIVAAGLATDYCVKNTVLDALKLGYKTSVATDGMQAVNVAPNDGTEAEKEMLDQGALLADSASLLAML